MLKDSQDAYGHQLYDSYKGRQVVEVVERDDGLLDPSDTYPKYYLSEYKDWSLRERQAARYVRGRVLDIGCGGGRWSLYLQKKGHDVLGIDISPLAVKVCKLRGLDTILMMGNNFGLFGRPKQARQLLKRFCDMTSPDAGIIAESLNIYRPPVDPVHRRYQMRNRRLGRMPGQVRMRIRYSIYATPWFDYLLVSKLEMMGILRGTGWKIKRFIESKKSPAYIGIIEKEKADA